MSEIRQSNSDPLEEATRAFQDMAVGERPADAEVLAKLRICQARPSEPFCIPIPSKRRRSMHLIASSTAAAVLLCGGFALFLWNNSPRDPVQVAAISSSEKPQDIGNPIPSRSLKVEREPLPPLEDEVADAQVILVAMALDSALAQPDRQGDLPEHQIRFRVQRLLKGELNDKIITVRMPADPAEFIGKEWIVMLSRDYMAGKYPYSSCSLAIEFEPTVKSILSLVPPRKNPE